MADATPDLTPEQQEIAALKAKLAEFRENNIALQQKLAERPAPKASEVRAEDASMADKLRQATERLEALETERKAEKAKMTRAELSAQIRRATKQKFVDESAVEFAMWRAEQEGWTINEHGAAVRLDGEGNVKMNGDGPETLGSWVSGLVKESGHLVRQPQGVGGGANGVGATRSKAGVEVVHNPGQDWIEANYAKIADGEVVVVHE